MVGASQLLVTLARFDIATAVMTMSSYHIVPRIGHLQCMKRIYGYVRNYPHARMESQQGMIQNIHLALLTSVVSMPKLNGLDATARIKRSHEQIQIIILLCITLRLPKKSWQQQQLHVASGCFGNKLFFIYTYIYIYIYI